MAKTTILMVDDDQNILDGYRRQLRKEFDIVTASSGDEAWTMYRHDGPFPIVVSDQKMPNGDGIELLSKISHADPNSVRVLLTGAADKEEAIQAINESHVFRFVSKPCTPEQLGVVLNDAVQQHKLVKAEKELVEKTLRGCVKALVEILSLIRPVAFGRTLRTRRLVRQIAKELDYRNLAQLEIAALLSQIGCVTLSDEILQSATLGEELSEHDHKALKKVPAIGHRLVGDIPRLGEISEMILHQISDVKELQASKKLSESGIVGAQILRVALDYDKLSGSLDLSPAQIVETLLQRKADGAYLPEVIDALKRIAPELSEEVVTDTITSLEQLKEGMTIAEDVFAVDGLLVIGRGYTVSDTMITRLRNLTYTRAIKFPVKVVKQEK